MRDLYGILSQIKEDPLKYLKRRSIVALIGFLNGYNVARRELGLPHSKDEQEFEEFQEWVEENLYRNYNKSWDKIILVYSEDEVQALDKFFVLLEKFQNRHNTPKKSRSNRDN